MKTIIQFIFPTMKAVFQVTLFLASLGWVSYGAILLIVKAEGREIKEQVMEIRKIDIEHIDKRFDQVIKEIKKVN